MSLTSAWETQEPRSWISWSPSLAIFLAAAVIAIIVFLAFHPIIESINTDSSVLIAAMFGPALAIGFLYGTKITGKAVNAELGGSPRRRAITKIFLFVFVMGGLFSSVNFALNGGSVPTTSTILDDGLVVWAVEFVESNGGVTFLVISSIVIMAAATRMIIKVGGKISYVFTFVGTFTFVTMLAMSLTRSSLTDSEVYLYTFYQAGIIAGAFFEMNRLTRNQNFWEDYLNGY